MKQQNRDCYQSTTVHSMINRLKHSIPKTVTIALLLLCLHCSSNDAGYSGSRTEAVHNEKPQNFESDITITHIKDFGKLKSDDRNYLFYGASDVAKDSANNVYILDYGNKRIQKFSESGEYLATIGSEGDGVLEFTYPKAITIDRENNLYVAEQIRGIVHRISPDGLWDEIIETKLKDIYDIRVVSPEKIFLNAPGNNGSSFRDNLQLIKTIDPDGNVITEFVESTDYGNKPHTIEGNAVCFAVDNNENVFVTFGTQNRIEKYDANGKNLLKIDRTLPYEIDPPEFGLYGTYASVPTAVSCGIDVDHLGRIWVCTYTRKPQEPGIDSKRSYRNYKHELNSTPDIQIFEIYNPDGILVQEIPLDFNIYRMRIFGDRLYLIGHDGVLVKEFGIDG